MHTQTHTHTHTHTWTHTHTHTSYINTHTCTQTYTHTHTDMYTCTYTRAITCANTIYSICSLSIRLSFACIPFSLSLALSHFYNLCFMIVVSGVERLLCVSLHSPFSSLALSSHLFILLQALLSLFFSNVSYSLSLSLSSSTLCIHSLS